MRPGAQRSRRLTPVSGRERLASGGSYEPIVQQGGRWASRSLGLDRALELGRVRFYAGSAPLPYADELIARLDTMVRELVAKEQDLAATLEAAQARAERLAARLRELGVEPDEE